MAAEITRELIPALPRMAAKKGGDKKRDEGKVAGNSNKGPAWPTNIQQ